MTYKGIYKDGERKQNPRCICPDKDKSKCFKSFRLNKNNEFDGWSLHCPYFDEISRSVIKQLNK